MCIRDRIYYPPKLHIEQTSSERAAAYKASLLEGNTIADLTGGLGVDSFYFAKKCKQVYHFEIDTKLSNIAAHNFKILQAQNITIANKNGLESINEQRYDVIYLDPARRDSSKQKVFQLEAYTPNVLEYLPDLFHTAPNILLKTAPLLDISDGIHKLKHVSEIHIVAIDNEVKELLWFLNKEAHEARKITAVNLSEKGTTSFSFFWKSEVKATFSLPKNYLYEPNAALLKSGAFSLISERFGVSKLAQHSHLYTSENLQNDFQGRIFEIVAWIPFSKKNISRFIKANITTRNFPESVANLRKKFKIQEGGDQYLFFTTLENGDRIVIICKK